MSSAGGTQPSPVLAPWAKALQYLRKKRIEDILDRAIQPRKPLDPNKPHQKVRISDPDTEILPLFEWPKDLLIALEHFLQEAERLGKDMATAKEFLRSTMVKRKITSPHSEAKVREVLPRDINVALAAMINRNSNSRSRESENPPSIQRRQRPQRLERMVSNTTIEDQAAGLETVTAEGSTSNTCKRAATSPPPQAPDSKRVDRASAPSRMKYPEMGNGPERIKCHNSSLETDYQQVDSEDNKLGSDHEPDSDSSCEEPEDQGVDYPDDDTYLDEALSDIEDEEDGRADDTHEDEGEGESLEQAPEATHGEQDKNVDKGEGLQQAPEATHGEQDKNVDKGDQAPPTATPQTEQQQTEADDADDEGEGDTGDDITHNEGEESEKEREEESVRGAEDKIDGGSEDVADEVDKTNAEAKKE